ncbi:DUF2721 domain-containing protein [Acidisoma silvae]|uniref:DUF2721 domain-containing protein n=1 Tax=Acidisoma silvae TaxID=2802396 RepID=A0A964E009_9PROT|nr:DUF2721 domain-containing protein [Acidisoma silvae]MCB8876856.1 DUF2721 domain-containing protein [Acidisoma silvae]
MVLPLNGDVVDGTAHIVQVALTPIFLLTGVGTLLNVFNTRLARVSDHNQRLAELMRAEEDKATRQWLAQHCTRLQHRLWALDAAVALTALAGAATCGTAFILFLGSLSDKAIASWLIVSFGVALVCVVCALIAFVIDTVLAWHGLRREGPLPRDPG